MCCTIHKLNNMERLIIKFNNGRGAILCSGCRKIIKEGHDFTPEESQYIRGEIDHLPVQFCDQCILKDTNSNEKV